MKIFLVFFLSCILNNVLKAEALILDRLVLEINGKSFTQREIEVYHMIEAVAMGNTPGKALAAPESWPSMLESFRNEMLVYTTIESDAQRMESFQPDNKAIFAAEKQVQSQKLVDQDLHKFFDNKKVSDQELSRILLKIFRVQAFVQTRAQLSGGDLGKAPIFLIIDPKSDWFDSLQKATPFRYFDGAKEYRKIQTLKGSGG